MQEKSITLTPNNRLARQLQKQFCIATSKTSWYTTTILPLGTWLKNCWQASPDPRILLDKQQEKLLWYKIIHENSDEKFKGFATLAAKSHELINNWEIKDHQESKNQTEDIIIFQHVRHKFSEYCRSKNLVTTSELPTLIIPYIRSYNLTEIILTGFDEYYPQLQTLITAIKKTGCKVSEEDPNNYQNSTKKLIGFDKLTQEIITSAKWAKKITEQHPEVKIGIVVPNLITLRPKIQQIFTELLPGNQRINISAGIPLNSLPIINAALEFLSSVAIINQEDQKFTASNLYFGKKNGEKTAQTQDLRSILPTEYRGIIKNCSEWAQIFATILQNCGWPGETCLTDIESTATQYFTKSIQKFAATDFIVGPITYKNAIQILHEFIASTILQPELETDTSINIFGTIEAIGINFDHLWVMGVDQENWPPAPKPNPFIPIEIQKKLSIPHSSADRELHFTKILINRYKRSAKEIIFSYVKQIADHAIAPSTLLTETGDILEISISDLELEPTTSYIQKIYLSKQLETLTDDNAPKCTGHIHAGSRLIELQSLCPFRAFMEFRLATKEPQTPELGISKIKRGILIHSALEKIWQQVKTQQTLCLFDQNQLQKLIAKSIEYSLNKLEIPQPFYKLEKQCLTLLITKWLEIEKKRQPFQVISTEKSVQCNLASIQIKLRIDRIDQLTNGDILLIDYKTGKNIPSIFDWFGARLKAPQLPLYSLTLESIQGLALAQINMESLKFKDIGLSELAIGFHTVTTRENNISTSTIKDIDDNESNTDLKTNITWAELRKHWNDTLTKIANDFVSGEASPTPISPLTCKQCSFGPACRIRS